MPPFAIAFDLDGTLIDNNQFHFITWQEFYRKRNRELTMDEYKACFNGRTMTDCVKYVFQQPDMPTEEIERYTNEKESLYREIYAAHIKPIPGLLALLELLDREQIPMVIATSGIQDNIDFLFSHIPIKQYFKRVIKGSDITHGKPHPEMYQLAAKELGLPAGKCIAFEDATVGITSAGAAGMKVVALTTTHTPEELAGADWIVKDYEGIRMEQLRQLFGH
ncbi:MAG TPA: HAD family phosphatase [Sediminibacterium sp.]